MMPENNKDIFTILDDMIADWHCRCTSPPEFILLSPKSYIRLLARINQYNGFKSSKKIESYHGIPLICSMNGIIYDEKD